MLDIEVPTPATAQRMAELLTGATPAPEPASPEPCNQYISGDGTCWRQGCGQVATHRLITRAKPDQSFPQGLLTESAYCLDDAVWFAGAQVALYGGTFISLTEQEKTHD